MKAAHQFIKFSLEGIDKKKNTATVKIKNTYNFTNLNEFYLVYEVVKNGKVVSSKSATCPLRLMARRLH